MISDLILTFGILGRHINLITMNKVLILGSSGMLGKMVSNYFISQNENEVVVTSRKNSGDKITTKNIYFDALNDKLEVIISEVKPEYVINCIGAIKPNIDEQNNTSVKNAFYINSYFPIYLSQLSILYNFKYIQIGTDCVFSGNKGNYSENSYQDAIDIYGKSKIPGEIQAKNKILIRSSIVGPESGNGKSLLNWFLNNTNNKIFGFSNHLWNGVTTLNFAKVAFGVVNEGKFNSGVYHLVPSDIVTKYELLKIFQKNFLKDILIEEKNSEIEINRHLKTVYLDKNIDLWNNGGYKTIPTIDENIEELYSSKITSTILNS